MSFDANLVCDSVGSIPCQISISGTSKNEVIFQISHTAKICEPEVKKEEVEDESDDEVIVEAPISPFPKTAKFDDTIIEKMMSSTQAQVQAQAQAQAQAQQQRQRQQNQQLTQRQALQQRMGELLQQQHFQQFKQHQQRQLQQHHQHQQQKQQQQQRERRQQKR